MEKEEKIQSSQGGNQEEAPSHSEFGLYEFFISDEESGNVEKATVTEELQDKKESESKLSNQSVTFFLPDFFSDDI